MKSTNVSGAFGAVGGSPKTDAETLAISDEQKEIHGSKDGSIYLGNKVRLNYTTTGEEGFDKQVSKLLTSIRGSEDGKTMLLALAAEGQSLGIVQYSSNVAARDGLGTVILFNASSTVGAGRIIFEQSGGRKVGSSLLPVYSLAHELFHAGQHTGASFFQPNAPLWGSPSKMSFEVKALRYTNQIRLQQGQNRV